MNTLSATLTNGQFNLVYNILSLGLASMLFTLIFLFVGRDRVLPRYRMAVMVSGTLTAIATYHYFRMFDNFNHAFAGTAAGLNNPDAYNVGYRYVDWLLTVPLLLVELVAVLALARAAQSSILNRLVPAAATMIVLGYPGDAKLDIMGIAPSVWGLLSTIPFLYILYVLFIELGKSLTKQSEAVQRKVKLLRLLLIATWGVYPITFILAMGSTGFNANEFVARIKSAEESADFAKTEFKD
jgi:bacteriorhodopsin